ncbi:MAG: Nif3-like dinuclear metal center hexameric protein [Bacteroidetes bacterium]|nr:Nif3-like dinuclear metal center hexameric protein [Bacteroidota bacterium]
MPTLQQIIDSIESTAPRIYQEAYDNSGLLFGNRHANIKKTMLCLDCTEEVLEDAISNGCQLIIAHHPIVFKGLKSLTGANYVERVMIRAIQKNIAIYACHTNLDNISAGVNAIIGKKLGLTNTSVLAPMKNTLKQLYTYAPLSEAESVRQALYKAGAGSIGNYTECSFNSIGLGTFKANKQAKPFIGSLGSLHEEKEVKIEVVYPIHAEQNVLKALHETHPYEEIALGTLQIEIENKQLGAGLIGKLPEPIDEKQFLKLLKTKMKTGGIRHTKLLGKPIQKVAVCGGSGSFLLQQAKKAGADVFVSADFKYHEFFDAENQLLIADIGHYESEQFTYEFFSELLSKKFPTFAILKTSVNTNPVNYYS